MVDGALRAISGLCLLLAPAIRFWPLLLVAWLFLSPQTPHIRWVYQYVWHAGEKHFVRCTYLGLHGLITPPFAPDCPPVALINPDDWR